MIARSYLALHAGWRKIQYAADVAFTGFWLGVLSRRALHAVDEAVYRRGTAYRGEAHNRRGLFAWERTALETHFPPSGRIGIIGAGGGREVLALSAQGYEAVGYECNAALVAAAQTLLGDGSRGSVTLLPRDQAPCGELFDGVVVGWSAYMLIVGRAARIRFLRAVRGALVPGAPVLLSFFTRSGDGGRLGAVAQVAGGLRRVLGREAVDVGDDLAPNYVHRFSPREVREEFAAAGFVLVEFHEQGPGPTDSGWAVGRTEDGGRGLAVAAPMRSLHA